LRRAAAGALAVVLACVGAAAGTGGCAHYPETAPLLPNQPTASRYTFNQLAAQDIDDDLLVCLAFSGGGTRAAALAYGVLEELRDTRIVRPKDGRAEPLLDEVDCISSVSGGSFVAAYYALFGARIFQDFRSVFLYRSVQSELAWKAANPFNWPRLLSPTFSRIDLASELYGKTIFADKTYGELLKANHRPFLILNATDLATGDDFEFTQDQFDLLGSDLGAFPLARAVAASSAFPFLLTPLSLTNHSQPAGYRPPNTIANGARDYYVNRRRFSWVSHQATYLDKHATPYVHVMDGGLADNIGLRGLLRELWEPSGFIAQRTNRGKTSNLILITVNAKNGGNDGGQQSLNQHESPPGLADVAFKTATIAMDNYSFDTIELARDQARVIEQARMDVEHCKKVARPGMMCPDFPAKYGVTVVDVSLDAITDPARREKLLSVGTNFALPAADVDMLIAAGRELLAQNPDFKDLIGRLRVPPPADGHK
jgi:NTE family protein